MLLKFAKGCDLMKYIDYNNMKEFYTIDEVCGFLNWKRKS